MATTTYIGVGSQGYRPKSPFNVPMYLLIPQKTTEKGSTKNKYPETGDVIFASFRTFGGTEKIVDNVLSIENTAVVETWYRPDIKSDCALKMIDNGIVYEIIGTPENINMRNQYLKFKVRAIKGGA